MPIHSWIHPWLPLLQSRLEPLYPPIRSKLSNALQRWHPSDASARLILQPWKDVFTPGAWEAFMVKNIIPKLGMSSSVMTSCVCWEENRRRWANLLLKSSLASLIRFRHRCKKSEVQLPIYLTRVDVLIVTFKRWGFITYTLSLDLVNTINNWTEAINRQETAPVCQRHEWKWTPPRFHSQVAPLISLHATADLSRCSFVSGRAGYQPSPAADGAISLGLGLGGHAVPL